MRLLVLLAGRAVVADVVVGADVLGIDVAAAKGLKSLRLVAAEGCLGVLLVVLGGIIASILSCLDMKLRSETRV